MLFILNEHSKRKLHFAIVSGHDSEGHIPNICVQICEVFYKINHIIIILCGAISIQTFFKQSLFKTCWKNWTDVRILFTFSLRPDCMIHTLCPRNDLVIKRYHFKIFQYIKYKWYERFSADLWIVFWIITSYTPYIVVEFLL